MQPKILLPLIVILFWLACISIATENFSHFTLESKRKSQIFKTQPTLPLYLVDDNHNTATLSMLAIKENKVIVAQFMYTRCRTICTTLGNQFQQTQRQIIAQGLVDKIHLTSISFDVEGDTAERLKSYRKLMRADQSVWTLATLKADKDLQLAKEQLGLMIVPSDGLDIVHNSAFLVINKTGRLVGIFDDNNIQDALTLAVKTI